MMVNAGLRVAIAGMVAIWIVGCGAPNEPKAGPGANKPQPPSGPATAETSVDSASSSPATTEPTPTTTAGAETAQHGSSQAGSGKVMLGSPELTAGIPGTGPLTKDQIAAWIDDPKNHEPLDIDLPLGLKAGGVPAPILKSNPMTRAKIELGRQLYFDARLSADGAVSCASCHHPDEGYGKHTQFGVGIAGQQGNRNSPISYNRIQTTTQFWDGRATSLEEQAKGPIANPIEMGNTHPKAVETVAGIEGYRMQFDKVFPGQGVTIDTIASAIATFERALVTGPSPFDHYEQLLPYKKLAKEDFDDDPALKKEYEARVAAAKAAPMSESAIRGRDLFFGQRVNCAACHVGANLADEKFHNLGVGMDKPDPDVGRFAVSKEEKDRGAFKTPTIRNVAQSAPYMHDGSLKTLLEVVEHYNKGGTPNPQLSDKMKKLDLTDQEKADLVAFMEACTGEFPKMETGRLPE